jgi:acetyltransferase-like isoleucine patch superfamily enzyme
MMSLLAVRYRLAACFLRHIDRRARVIGWRNIEFGRNVAVGTGSWLNVNARRDAGKTLTFGDNCFIGRNNFISVGKSVSIGPYCLTGESCSFIGATHVADPTRPYRTTGVTAEDEIVVGANCFFGYGASVLGNVRIGHGCIVGAHSFIRADVPPFSIVVGNPARVIKRFDFTSGDWRSDWEGRELLHPTEQEYLGTLRASHPWPVLPISAATCGPGDV